MNGSARYRSPTALMNACCSSPATRPTSNIRSPRRMRSRSIAATSPDRTRSSPASHHHATRPAGPATSAAGPATGHATTPAHRRPTPDAAHPFQPTNDRVEIAAVGIEIDPRTIRRPVVQRGQEVGERGQPPVQVRIVMVVGRTRDRVAELLPGIVLDRQHTVDLATDPQRTDHMMWRPDQVVAAERLKPPVLPPCHPACLVPVGAEPRAVELADHLGAAGPLLVAVDHVAARVPEHAKRRPRLPTPSRSRTILLRNPCSGSCPATSPTYLPFIIHSFSPLPPAPAATTADQPHNPPGTPRTASPHPRRTPSRAAHPTIAAHSRLHRSLAATPGRGPRTGGAAAHSRCYHPVQDLGGCLAAVVGASKGLHRRPLL
jgi:hypothetical protein